MSFLTSLEHCKTETVLKEHVKARVHTGFDIAQPLKAPAEQ